MDRNSYNSGDWFNRLDWTLQSNNFGVGLPPAGDNEDNWPLIGPRLANPLLKPGSADLQANFAHAQELLEIRGSSPLFRLQTEADVMGRLQFTNTGPSQTPGLIVMRLSDQVDALPDIDYWHEQIVVLFNASDEAQSYTLPDTTGKFFKLHGVQGSSADPVVRTSAFEIASGKFSVPARTTAVFVLAPNYLPFVGRR
jgi:pullulanase/glycogen debranching enzyme